MKLCKPNRISLWADEKIFMNANQMGALKLLTGQSWSLFFCLRFEFMLSLRQNMKFWRPTIFASLQKLALSRNVLNNKSVIVVYTGDLFTGTDFDTMIYLSVLNLGCSLQMFILATDRGWNQLVKSFKVYIWKWRCRTHLWSLITTSLKIYTFIGWISITIRKRTVGVRTLHNFCEVLGLIFNKHIYVAKWNCWLSEQFSRRKKQSFYLKSVEFTKVL